MINVWTKCPRKTYCAEISTLQANKLVSEMKGVWTIKGQFYNVVQRPKIIMDRENEILYWIFKLDNGVTLEVYND